MQSRTIFAASAIGLSIVCVAGFASAQQIYKWKDSGGVTHFSQSPPTKGAHYTKMQLANAPDVSSESPAHTASNAEAVPEDQDTTPQPQDANNKKTQPNTPSNRAELCKQLTSNIVLLQGKKPVVTGGSSGKQEVMSDHAREQQLATAHAQQAQYCSK